MEKLKEYLLSKKTILIMILAMSLPAIIEMALNTMLGVADTIMLSRFIGKEALSSAGFANQIVFTLIFVFSSFNTGAVALISRSYGEKNFKRLKDVAVQNVTLNLFLGLIMTVIGLLFSKIIFGIYDVSERVYLDSVKYFEIILIGLLPMFLSFSFAATLRGSGNTKTPMIITCIANIINIIGNYVLILGIGPFPKLGIAGAAWATTGSRYIATFLYIYVLYFKDSKFRLKFRLLLNKDIIKPLWNISLPGAIEQALMQLSFVLLGVIVSKLDTVAEASFRILIQIESLSFMPAVGMSIATATLVGKSLGEKNSKKAVEIGYLSTLLGLIWAVIMASFFIIFPSSIIGIFSNEAIVITTGIPVMLFLAINQLGLNIQIVISGALRGAGDTKVVMLNTILRLWIIFVPSSFIFINIFNTGLVGIWYAEIISFIFFSTHLLLRFKSKKWIKEI
ncbi:MATE family efflux transporter [Thiospirochaeta perfilievii]|uniref:Multidrug-efflux transporter n=1 Tax=Thiospirochaeta perfilievii TaxID=252967 RepID=A0A5C1Q531_9SPIO|nr:MATE family efflux transporter [Thiospirochaeta perfilievii]QEN03173.1 MATE family efflux transporter [Thiospirochaeta perfilievii]